MGVHAELNGDNGGHSLVEWRSIYVEVCDLTSFREVDRKVLRVSSVKREYGVSSLKRHCYGFRSRVAIGVALTDGDGTSVGFASNSNLFDSCFIF